MFAAIMSAGRERVTSCRRLDQDVVAVVGLGPRNVLRVLYALLKTVSRAIMARRRQRPTGPRVRLSLLYAGKRCVDFVTAAVTVRVDNKASTAVGRRRAMSGHWQTRMLARQLLTPMLPFEG